MIDTHCHLDQAVFNHDRAAVLARSRQAGVSQWLVPGICLSGFPAIVALHSSTIHIALGLHPLFSHPDNAIEQLASWLEQTNPIAIGEIGLDYLAPAQTHPIQRRLFEEQLLLAQDARCPVLLHVRKAHAVVIAMLRQQAFSCGGIVHAFNGSLQQADQYIDLGFRLGFGGVVTHDRALRIRRLAALLPEDALVLETDAPDLPPAGHHGERNEPGYLPLVAQTLAQLRHVSIEHIMAVTSNNAQLVLGLQNGDRQ